MMTDFAVDTWRSKIWRRVKRIMIPYVCWNVLFVVFYLIAGLFVPRMAARVSSFGLDTVAGVLGKVLSFTIHPIDGPLWFLRSIFLYSLAAPLIYFCIKTKCLLWALIGYIGVTYGSGVEKYLEGSYPVYSIICYSLGAFFAQRGLDPTVVFSGWKWRVIGVAGTFVWFIEMLGASSPGGWLVLSDWLISILKLIGAMLGLPLLWAFIVPIDSALSGRGWFVFISKASFFIYAGHFLFCSVALHSIAPHIAWMGVGKMSVLVLTFCGLGLVLCLSFYALARRLMPRLIKFLDGSL